MRCFTKPETLPIGNGAKNAPRLRGEDSPSPESLAAPLVVVGGEGRHDGERRIYGMSQGPSEPTPDADIDREVLEVRSAARSA